MKHGLDRRTTLVVLGGGLAATQAAGLTQPRFFTAEEMALLDCITELIIPADDRSPGARAARVAEHIDLVAANSDAGAQKAWKDELAALAEAARERYGRGFVQLSVADQAALLDSLAARERQPVTAAERCFVSIKRAAIFAYYSSRIGLVDELGYRGNEMLAEFRGCTHEVGKHREKF